MITFSGWIFGVNIDGPARCGVVSIYRSSIFKSQAFHFLACIIFRPDSVKYYGHGYSSHKILGKCYHSKDVTNSLQVNILTCYRWIGVLYHFLNYWVYHREIFTRFQGIWRGAKSVNYASENFKKLIYLVSCNVTSSYGNSTKLCAVINIIIRNSPYNFRIDISKIDHSRDQFVKCWSVKYRPVCKMQTKSRDVI